MNHPAATHQAAQSGGQPAPCKTSAAPGTTTKFLIRNHGENAAADARRETGLKKHTSFF